MDEESDAQAERRDQRKARKMRVTGRGLLTAVPNEEARKAKRKKRKK